MMGWAGRKLSDRTGKGESEGECLDNAPVRVLVILLACAESRWSRKKPAANWKTLEMSESLEELEKADDA